MKTKIPFRFTSGDPPIIHVKGADGKRYTVTLGVIVTAVTEDGKGEDGLPKFGFAMSWATTTEVSDDSLPG